MEPIFRVRKSPFIRKFEKTPRGIFCPHFYILGWCTGCPFQCDYCFLQGTLRGQVTPQLYTNMADLEKELVPFLRDPWPVVFNCGELGDGLWNEKEVGFLDTVLPIFNSKELNPHGHKLLLLTKSIEVETLLKYSIENEIGDNIIVSWSVNAEEVSEKYEHGSPTPYVRLEMAKSIRLSGYRVRLRIDPMIPVYGWEEGYAKLVGRIFTEVRPERITIGSLRYFPMVPGMARMVGRNDQVFSYGDNQHDPDGRLRIPFETRLTMYRYILDKIDSRCESGICKETVSLHKALISMGYKANRRCRCNCTL